MLVGPSAPPMIPMVAASFRSEPKRTAQKNVRYTPTWAPAPRKISRGWLSKGPKSVIAPRPRKMRGGITSQRTP